MGHCADLDERRGFFGGRSRKKKAANRKNNFGLLLSAVIIEADTARGERDSAECQPRQAKAGVIKIVNGYNIWDGRETRVERTNVFVL